MLNDKNVSLSELLRDFNAGLLGKQAEEETPEAGSQPIPETEACPVCGESPCACVSDADDEDDGVMDGGARNDETASLQNAAATVNAKQEEAVDAAKALRDMADAYIAKHDDSLEKEAALFGEIFAKSAMLHMNPSYMYDAYDYDYDDYGMSKSAAEAAFTDAYNYAFAKLAAEAAYADAVQAGATEEQAELVAAKAVSDAAAAARALAEHVRDSGSTADAEAVAGQAASEAYQQAMREMGAVAPVAAAPAQVTPEEQASAEAYEEAMRQAQAAQAAQPTGDAAQVGGNAYNVAMQQLGQA